MRRAGQPTKFRPRACVSGVTWLSLAVVARGSRRQRTDVNLNGRLRTTLRGFEDRGATVQERPPTSVPVQSRSPAIPDRSPLSAAVHGLGW